MAEKHNLEELLKMSPDVFEITEFVAEPSYMSASWNRNNIRRTIRERNAPKARPHMNMNRWRRPHKEQ